MTAGGGNSGWALLRSEVRRFGPNPGGSMPPYQVMTTIYCESVEAFQAFATSPLLAQLMADVPYFSSGPPEQFAGEVIYSAEYKPKKKP